ncbi:DNA primase [Candidatus Falkowbacteria bacterium HGW-Falkowbacteria-1]|jgi:DNA primase|uniref:DNA primase n=1 Tax=Candidatus Falkowbacteria bacterium HGW-Falkowbacteria-1 TaxID=2013768 RepID=A0A2N2E957_9BACT|nr:MAG: DNA primase [Candidatus Falkowbacteria bacterium HGW-Falkowbacteria-1]
MNHSEEIKAKLDIVDVVSGYLNLKAAGSNFRATCPFHNEKTPSFMVSPEKQIWHCFGCGKGGDIFSFVMEMEGLDFVETIKLLAPKAGVILDDKDFSQDKNKNRSLEILELSQKYYNFILTNEKNKNDNIIKIREYLLGRGLDLEAINRWGIGYSLNSFDDLSNFLKSKKFTENEIFLSGMSVKNEKGRHYNRFRDRIMFPIKDVSGRTLAFTARVNPFAENNDKSMGKYINSPQTTLYDKSRILFALDKAKMAIKEKGFVIIVEGQMDAITAHEAGFKNLVASSGTALTIAQLNLIKRYTNNLVLSFDQDLAGLAATDRGVAEALKMGLNLKIISFEGIGAKDPDEIIRQNPEAFKRAVDNAKNIIDYYLTEESKNVDLSKPELKNKSVHKILTVINMLYNKVEQDFWLKELSQKYDVNEDSLREEILKIGKKDNKTNISASTKNKGKNFIQQEKADAKSRDDKLFELLLALIFRFPQIFDYVVNNLNLEYILEKYRKLYDLMLVYYNENNKKLDYNQFLAYISTKEDYQDASFSIFLNKIGLLADFYLQEQDDSDLENKIKKEVTGIILEIKKLYYKNLVRNKKEELILLEKRNDKDEISGVMNDLKSLSEELKKLE